MASPEESSESLQSKTWVFKVSIHCEGCKKKVLKILGTIPGVFETEVDARQHKVTMKASVDADTIIRRLEKSGKHVELWPQKKPANRSSGNDVDASGNKEGTEKPKPKEPSANSEPTPAASKPSDRATTPEAKTEHPKPSDKAEETTAEKKHPQAPESSTTDGEETTVSSTGGGKKKGKKAQKHSTEYTDKSSSAETPRYVHSYPQYPMPPPPPAYVMSYSVAQPSTSQAYYAPLAPPASQDFPLYPYPYPDPYPYPYPPPPPDFPGSAYYYNTSAWVQPPQRHYNMFCDENPDACNLM